MPVTEYDVGPGAYGVAVAADGSRAEFGHPWAGPVPDVAALAAAVLAPRAVAVLLVRRGGYACAVVRDGTVVASKVGARYVQGRTAAGGWSQQRFARRRDNQTEELVGSAVDVAARLLLQPPCDTIATGGDRPLVDRVLAHPRLRALVGGAGGAVVDVSAQRTTIRLGGPHARDVLEKGCAIDLHPRSFPPGSAAQTTVGRAGVVLLAVDEG